MHNPLGGPGLRCVRDDWRLKLCEAAAFFCQLDGSTLVFVEAAGVFPVDSQSGNAVQRLHCVPGASACRFAVELYNGYPRISSALFFIGNSELLRTHIETFGTVPDGRLFRSENGNPIQPSTWWQVWQKVRAASLTPQQLATPLMKRPYDLRHSGITWRLDSGVPATEVAAWVGHSVVMLMRVYARCVAGLEGVWIGRMDQSLHLEEP